MTNGKSPRLCSRNNAIHEHTPTDTNGISVVLYEFVDRVFW
jgi:hypothetical protein